MARAWVLTASASLVTRKNLREPLDKSPCPRRRLCDWPARRASRGMGAPCPGPARRPDGRTIPSRHGSRNHHAPSASASLRRRTEATRARGLVRTLPRRCGFSHRPGRAMPGAWPQACGHGSGAQPCTGLGTERASLDARLPRTMGSQGEPPGGRMLGCIRSRRHALPPEPARRRPRRGCPAPRLDAAGHLGDHSRPSRGARLRHRDMLRHRPTGGSTCIDIPE